MMISLERIVVVLLALATTLLTTAVAAAVSTTSTATTSSSSTAPKKTPFIEYIEWLNSRYIDAKFFCSSSSSTGGSSDGSNYHWLLRNKKCMNFSDQRASFMDASRTCRKRNAHLLHRKELAHLTSHSDNHQKGLDMLAIYENLLLSTTDGNNNNNASAAAQTQAEASKKPFEFAMWLEDNYYADYQCNNSPEFAPIARFNRADCAAGCYECARRKTPALYYFTCVRACEWKVPSNSYCNTDELTAGRLRLSNNVYLTPSRHLFDTPLYACQAHLRCIDFRCVP